QGTSNTVTTLEDTPYVFSVADFGFSDPNDSPPNNFSAVFTTMPTAGTLTDNNTVITTGQFVPLADVTAHRLIFTPDADANGIGYANFTFQVQDNGGTANSGQNLDPTPNTMTINVTAVNDAPSFISAGDETVSENSGPQSVATWASSISAGPTDEAG